MFLLAGDIRSRVASAAESGQHALLLGGSLMLLYLAVDGLTSTWQDRLFRSHSMEITDQVLYTTAFSSVFSLVAGGRPLGRCRGRWRQLPAWEPAWGPG
jgi:adenosine 3'-phospho 5'-phosphosulfate transporter B2